MTTNTPLESSQKRTPPTETVVAPMGAGSGMPPAIAEVVSEAAVMADSAMRSIFRMGTPFQAEIQGDADGTASANFRREYITKAEARFLTLWEARLYGDAATIALRVALSSPDPHRFNFTSRAGCCFWKAGECVSARACFEAAHSLRHTTKDARLLGRHHTNYGLLCLSTGRYDVAVELFEAAHLYYTETNDRALLASAFNNLALAHGARGEDTEALGYLALAEEVYEELGEREKLIEVADSRLRIRVRQAGGAVEDWGASYGLP